MKTQIKYDLKTKNVFRIVAIVSLSVLLVLAILGLLINVISKSKPDVAENYIGAMAAGMIISEFSVMVFLISFLSFLAAKTYLKRLYKNGFELPYTKKEYDGLLDNLPREGEYVFNKYAKDSKLASVAAAVLYIVAIGFDVHYLLLWSKYGMQESAKALFVILLILFQAFLFAALTYRKQMNEEVYVDDVDIRAGKKVRTPIMTSACVLLILSLLTAFAINTAHSMTRYIYLSKNSGYERTMDQFVDGATMKITSESLHDGIWDTEIVSQEGGSNLSPQLSFDKVDGADSYVVYMVDETAGNWIHWVAYDLKENELELGVNETKYSNNESFKYIGPYPPAGSGSHKYTVYVFALKGTPGKGFEYGFDEKKLAPNLLYYNNLNVEKSGKIPTFGNVLAYGYVSGEYENK